MEEAALSLGVRGHRIANMSDALFSIIATITCAPLAASVASNRIAYPDAADIKTVKEALQESVLPLVYCIVTFNIVSRMQMFHCIIFDHVDRASALVVLVNTLYLLAVSLIPVAYTLLSEAALETDGQSSVTFNSVDSYAGPAMFFVCLLSVVRR